MKLRGSLTSLFCLPTHLQDKSTQPSIVEVYKKFVSRKKHRYGYSKLSLVYARSTFRDFESYLRNVGDLDEDHIQLFSKQSS